MMDEAKEKDASLNRVEERGVLSVFGWWFIVARLGRKRHVGF